MKYTCVKFEEVKNRQENHITISYDNLETCAADLGYKHKRQAVVLAGSCMHEKTLIQVLMRALGYPYYLSEIKAENMALINGLYGCSDSDVHYN